MWFSVLQLDSLCLCLVGTVWLACSSSGTCGLYLEYSSDVGALGLMIAEASSDSCVPERSDSCVTKRCPVISLQLPSCFA